MCLDVGGEGRGVVVSRCIVCIVLALIDCIDCMEQR